MHASGLTPRGRSGWGAGFDGPPTDEPEAGRRQAVHAAEVLFVLHAVVLLVGLAVAR